MILVVGGAGYIGSHCVNELIRRGSDVVVVDNLQTGHRDAVHPKAIFLEGDIRDAAFLRDVFAKHAIESVFHFAASSLVGESMRRPLAYYNNNVHGMEVLLSAMAEADVLRIVFSSSAAVYGESKREKISEKEATHPLNPYGETKLAMERMMRWCDTAHGIRYVALRYFNVAGAASGGEIGEDHRPETHLIPLVLQVALGKRDKVTIFGNDYPTPDGTCIRDYIHIEDLIEAHLLALRYLEAENWSRSLNLGSGKGYSVLEIIEAARRVTGHPIPVEVGERREGDPARLVATSRLARQLIFWRRKHNSIDDIIRSAWEFHKAHPEGFSK